MNIYYHKISKQIESGNLDAVEEMIQQYEWYLTQMEIQELREALRQRKLAKEQPASKEPGPPAERLAWERIPTPFVWLFYICGSSVAAVYFDLAGKEGGGFFGQVARHPVWAVFSYLWLVVIITAVVRAIKD